MDVHASARRAEQPSASSVCKLCSLWDLFLANDNRFNWRAVKNGGGAQFRGATLRQTLHVSIGAPRIRIQISNTFGGSDLTITAASIALPQGGRAGVGQIDTATLKPLTFNNGASSITIPRGQVKYTDAIDFAVQPQSMISVSLYLANGQSGSSITGHPGSRTTSWMANGNQVNAANVAGANTKHW
jgi:hypothetical protein